MTSTLPSTQIQAAMTALNSVGDLVLKGDMATARQIVSRVIKTIPDLSLAHDWWILLNPEWEQSRNGPRLKLRGLQIDDAPFLHDCFASNSFMQLFNPTAPRNRSIEVITRQISQSVVASSVAKTRSMHWIVEHNDGRRLGLVTLSQIVVSHRRVELLLGLPDASNYGTGFAIEACLLVLDFCFNTIGLQKIAALVVADNPHSQKTLISLGFEQEGYLRDHLRIAPSHRFIACYENGITVSSFRANDRLAKLSIRLLKRDITKGGLKSEVQHLQTA